MPNRDLPGTAYYVRKIVLTFAGVAAMAACFYLVVAAVAEHWLEAGAQYVAALLLLVPAVVLNGVYLVDGL